MEPSKVDLQWYQAKRISDNPAHYECVIDIILTSLLDTMNPSLFAQPLVKSFCIRIEKILILVMYMVHVK
jgi:hypothetical protein